MDAAAELGRNPVSKHHIQPEYGDEQADAGRDGRTRLARPNSQARTGPGEYYFPCSADHEQDWQPYPVDPYSAICDDHTYIHTYIIPGWSSSSPLLKILKPKTFLLTQSASSRLKLYTLYNVYILHLTCFFRCLSFPGVC